MEIVEKVQKIEKKFEMKRKYTEEVREARRREKKNKQKYLKEK